MPTWKLNIFVRVVSRKMEDEDRTTDDILTNDYPRLADTEVTDIKNAL
jgi:hypothetical protein